MSHILACAITSALPRSWHGGCRVKGLASYADLHVVGLWKLEHWWDGYRFENRMTINLVPLFLDLKTYFNLTTFHCTRRWYRLSPERGAAPHERGAVQQERGDASHPPLEIRAGQGIELSLDNFRVGC